MAGFEINAVTISGNLTRDVELRATRSGTDVASLRIAHNSRRKVGEEWEDEVHFFDVTLWKGMARWVAENVRKGQKVVVAGRLQWREWEDKDGNKRQSVDVVADSIVPERSGSGGGNGNGGRSSGGDPSATDESQFSAPGASDFSVQQQRQPATQDDDSIPF